MAKSSIEKYTARVKQIKKAHPNMTHKGAKRQASAEFRSAKVSGVKKKSKAKRPLYKSSFSIGRVKKKAKKKKVGKSGPVARLRKAHEKEGLLLAQIGSVAQQRTRLKKQYEEQLAWKLLALSQAPTKTKKKKIAKKVTELKRDIRAVSVRK
jgi:hypothetical protein